MSRESIGKLMDQWINDPSFREELRGNPEEAVRNSKMELNEEEWAALKSIDWSLSDEELKLRANKAM